MLHALMSFLLCRITQKIHQTLGSGDSKKGVSDDLFPLLPGSHLDLHNPALEFVKSICKVRYTHCLHVNRLKHVKLRWVHTIRNAWLTAM